MAVPPEPFALPGTNTVHLAAIFGDFRQVLDRKIGELRSGRQLPYQVALGGILARVRDEVDPQGYAEFQRRYVRPDSPTDVQGALKFLDTAFWIDGKLRIAWRLGLRGMPAMDILDLGTGPGYFCLIAGQWGHRPLGLDLPEDTSPVSGFYGDLRRLFGVECVPAYVDAATPLPHFNQKFELVTGLLVNFNLNATGEKWTPADWSVFLDRLAKDILVPHGRLFLQLTEKTSQASWSFLVRLADWHLRKAMQVEIPAASLKSASHILRQINGLAAPASTIR